jgi:peptidoglycan/xylan/chitin deacetylase (PgdA/CDA1 family)
MIVTIIICVTFFLVYAFIPNYFARHYSKNVIKKLNKNDNTIALTFDDGPDSEYTKEILDILDDNNVKATFFIVANKVDGNIDVLNRMLKEGHCIAMHSYKHKSAWLSLPWETFIEFKKSLKIFNYYGFNIKYFRPPWGTFNIFTLRAAIKNNLKTILWTVEAFDWRKNNNSNNINNIINSRVGANDIIVLHDSGGAVGSPRNTVEALKNILPSLLEKGYKFITIEEGIDHD